jgi:hypothetical protein
MPSRTAARTAVFIPGAGPPPCRIARRSCGLARMPGSRGRPDDRVEGVPGLGEAAPAHLHGPVVVTVGDASATALVCSTLSISGDETMRFSRIPIDLGLVFGAGPQQQPDRGVAAEGPEVAVERARCAATLDVPEDRDPRVLPEPLLEDLLTRSAVIGLPAVSWAPSATTTMFCRRPFPARLASVGHLLLPALGVGGRSGMKVQLAPAARPLIRAR